MTRPGDRVSLDDVATLPAGTGTCWRVQFAQGGKWRFAHPPEIQFALRSIAEDTARRLSSDVGFATRVVPGIERSTPSEARQWTRPHPHACGFRGTRHVYSAKSVTEMEVAEARGESTVTGQCRVCGARASTTVPAACTCPADWIIARLTASQWTHDASCPCWQPSRLNR